MSFQRKVLFILVLLGFCITMVGCGAAKKNAQLASQFKAKEWKPKVQEMANNMGDYDIYAAGRNRKTPWAIVFHPKDNPKKLQGTPDRWHKIEDKKVLDGLISWMETYRNPPRLLSLLGPEPERDFYAYIYTPLSQMNTRIVDDNTIFVYEPDPTMMPQNI